MRDVTHGAKRGAFFSTHATRLKQPFVNCAMPLPKQTKKLPAKRAAALSIWQPPKPRQFRPWIRLPKQTYAEIEFASSRRRGRPSQGRVTSSQSLHSVE